MILSFRNIICNNFVTNGKWGGKRHFGTLKGLPRAEPSFPCCSLNDTLSGIVSCDATAVRIRIRIVRCQSGVAPANQTKENEVRELSGKESGISSGTHSLRAFVQHLQAKRVSGTSSGLLPQKFMNLTFFGLVCRNHS